MKCDDFRQQIDFGLNSRNFEISAELESHMEGCESCRNYSIRLVNLRNVLNRQKFEIRPGELDSITFENIVAGEERSLERPRPFETIITGLRRWLWVPATAAVAIAAVVFYMHFARTTVEPGTTTVGTESADSGYVYDEVENISDWSFVIKSLITNESEFEVADQELSGEVDFNEALFDLSDEQLNTLYNRIEMMNGSAL